MDEIKLYPYRIRVTDPKEIDVFKKVSNFHVIRTQPNIAKSIGHKVPRKIKRDGFFINNGRIGIDNPRLRLDFEPAYGKRKGIDVIFKSLF